MLPYWNVCVTSLNPSLPAGAMLWWADCLNSTPWRNKGIRHGVIACEVLLQHSFKSLPIQHDTPLLQHVTETRTRARQLVPLRANGDVPPGSPKDLQLKRCWPLQERRGDEGGDHGGKQAPSGPAQAAAAAPRQPRVRRLRGGWDGCTPQLGLYQHGHLYLHALRRHPPWAGGAHLQGLCSCWLTLSKGSYLAE